MGRKLNEFIVVGLEHQMRKNISLNFLLDFIKMNYRRTLKLKLYERIGSRVARKKARIRGHEIRIDDLYK